MKKLSVVLISIMLFCSGCFETDNGVVSDRASVCAFAVLEQAEAGMSEFIEKDRDNYFSYMEEEEYKALMERFNGAFGGIGVLMQFSKDETYPIITEVYKKSPAEAGGLKEGEKILAVNGKDIAGILPDDVSGLIRGPENTEVRLIILSIEEEKREVVLRRRKTDVISAEEFPLEEYPQIAYIVISSFAQNTVQEFKDIWKEINEEREISGLIIDLRNNGGGSFNACLQLASCFVPKNEPLVYQQTKKGMTKDVSSGEMHIDLPVVILQNEYSASASEVFLGAMLDNGCAVSVGTQSFGKGITQGISRMFSGHGYRYTMSMYYTPSMFALHGIGITPNYDVEMQEEWLYDEKLDIRYKEDTQLHKAIEILTSEKEAQ